MAPFKKTPSKRAASADLFQSSAAPADAITANIDGGARGNPGPAGYGAYIRDAKGKTLAQLSEFIGLKSNNVAEYSALLAALTFALEHGHRALRVFSDSELLVKQMNGQYKVASPDLRPLYEKARMDSHKLDYFEVRHVYREQNREADRLANLAMDKGMGRSPSSNATAATDPGVSASSAGGVKEVAGIVVNGVVEFVGQDLPNGTRVKVRKAD